MIDPMVLSGYHPISCSSAPLTAKLLKISGLHCSPPVPPLPFSFEPTVTRLCPQRATETALAEVPVTPLLASTLAISQSSSLTSQQLWTWLTILSFLEHFLHLAFGMDLSISLISPLPSLAISPPTSKHWDPSVQCLVLFSMFTM